MAEYKKQHYVPQFYLRNFSSTSDEKKICLFNIQRKKIIEDVCIKMQCQKDYFYGEDLEIEKALGVIEKTVSEIFSRILDEEKCVEHISTAHIKICMFIIIQDRRTLFAKNEMESNLDKYYRNILETHIRYKYPEENYKEILDVISINFREIPRMIIKSTFTTYILILNLKQHILINRTSQGFITSDNPVFIYNSYYVNSKNIRSAGLAFAGLQIFIPLSSKIAICLFDSQIYNYGKNNFDYTDINKLSDVEELNKCQFINSLNNLYAKAPSSFSDFKKYSRIKQEFIDRNIFVQGKEEIKGNLIEQTIGNLKLDVDVKLRLSFIRTKKKFNRVPVNERELSLRDPVLSQHVDVFTKKVKEGKYNVFEFNKYIRSIENN